MLTEAQKATLVHHLQTNVEWRYPLSGSNQYDFDPGTGIYVYRQFEPVPKKYPNIKIHFLRCGQPEAQGLGQVLKYVSGVIIYGQVELQPMTITVYTHQTTEGTNGVYHGKLVADAYIRRIDRYIRRYWPKLLEDMEASIYQPMSFSKEDISIFLQGDEKQGFEMTITLETVNRWDNLADDYTGVEGTTSEHTEYFFEDATWSGQESGDANWMKFYSVSGQMHMYGD